MFAVQIREQRAQLGLSLNEKPMAVKVYEWTWGL
jgi:hypothetical protein